MKFDENNRFTTKKISDKSHRKFFMEIFFKRINRSLPPSIICAPLQLTLVWRFFNAYFLVSIPLVSFSTARDVLLRGCKNRHFCSYSSSFTDGKICFSHFSGFRYYSINFGIIWHQLGVKIKTMIRCSVLDTTKTYSRVK